MLLWYVEDGANKRFQSPIDGEVDKYEIAQIDLLIDLFVALVRGRLGDDGVTWLFEVE